VLAAILRDRSKPLAAGTGDSVQIGERIKLVCPTGIEPKTIKNEGDGEDSEVFDIRKLKKTGD
jgi:hypothetical protein